MKRRMRELAAIFLLSGPGLAGGPSFAAEFEVLDRFSVDGYTVLRGSADITSGSFAVGGSTIVVKGGNVGIGTTNPGSRFEVVGGSSTLRGLDTQKNIAAFGSASGDFKVVISTSGNLDVAGGIKVGTVTTNCASTIAGTLRWYDGHISVCNGEAWRQLDNQAPPTISALSPDNGPVSGGTPITITGSGFVPGPELLINGLTATAITVVSVTQITAVTPASGTTGLKTVKLTNPDGQNIAGSFTYNPLPSFSAVDPNNGPVSGGTSITINGTSFVSGASVTIDATMVNATFINDTRLTAVTPAGSLGLKNVTVTNPDKGLLLLTGAFTYNALPVITSPLSPNNGRSTGGNAITINGSGFVSGAAVKIGGNSVTGLSISAGQITGTSPAGTIGSQAVTVTNPDGGYGELAGGFTYNPLPTVTSVSPAYGPQTTVLTIAGTGFMANAVVTIPGATVSAIAIDSPSQIRVLTHASPASGAKDVTVTNPDAGSATKTSGFTYTVYATGGTESVSGSYRIHTFTAGGTFIASTAGDVEYLVAAGGGGGGGNLSGGGGGGGVKTATLPISVGSYSITVGAGGAGSLGTQVGTSGASGGDSSVGILVTATGGGGGGGGANGSAAGGGGSGGGGSGYGAYAGGAGIGGQGYAGGTGGGGAPNYPGGGGGGAGGIGATVVNSSSRGGNGGPGALSAINGTTLYWGGGGGGGGYTGGIGAGNGGVGGGGGGSCDNGTAGSGGGSALNSGANGAVGSPSNGGAAGTNTGGGGGGTSHVGGTWPTGGNGGSGIVIIRYPIVPGLTVPTVTSVSPASGLSLGGTAVTITGTGFASSVSVTIGNVAVTSFSRNSASQITATTPASTNFGDNSVTVTNLPDQSYGVKTGGFTYIVSGATCKAIKLLSGGSAGDGTYWIDPNGGSTSDAFQAYCNMTTDGGGWTQLFNLKTNSGTDHGWGDTAFWQAQNTYSSAAGALTSDFKSQAFSSLTGFGELMFYQHNNSALVAYGIYSMSAGYLDKSFYTLMNIAESNTGTVVTGARVKQSGNSGAVINTLRTQTRYGDEFVDSQNGDPVVINWHSVNSRMSTDAIMYTRISTNWNNYTYQHTFTGLGYHHERPAGSYITDAEYAPISAYCDLMSRYGTDATLSGGFCMNASATTLPRDMAIFVR